MKLSNVFLEAYGVLFDKDRSDSIVEMKSPFSNDDMNVVRYVDERGGHIDIWIDSPWAPRDNSVVEFEVNESMRGHGIGDALVKYVLSKYNSLSAQVSSMASLKVFYTNGFRPHDRENSTFEEVTEMFRENGNSLGMMTK